MDQLGGDRYPAVRVLWAWSRVFSDNTRVDPIHVFRMVEPVLVRSARSERVHQFTNLLLNRSHRVLTVTLCARHGRSRRGNPIETTFTITIVRDPTGSSYTATQRHSDTEITLHEHAAQRLPHVFLFPFSLLTAAQSASRSAAKR